MATSITLRDYEEAERQLTRKEERQGFRIHAAIYLLVNLLLFGINMAVITRTGEDFVWFVFPLVFWGIGLAMHYYFGVRAFELNMTARQQRIEHLASSRHAS